MRLVFDSELCAIQQSPLQVLCVSELWPSTTFVTSRTSQLERDYGTAMSERSHSLRRGGIAQESEKLVCESELSRQSPKTGLCFHGTEVQRRPRLRLNAVFMMASIEPMQAGETPSLKRHVSLFSCSVGTHSPYYFQAVQHDNLIHLYIVSKLDWS